MEVHNKINNQEIFINEEVIKKVSDTLEVGDIFSVRRYGKFCFREIEKKTKKDNLIIMIDKYV